MKILIASNKVPFELSSTQKSPYDLLSNLKTMVLKVLTYNSNHAHLLKEKKSPWGSGISLLTGTLGGRNF